MAEKQVGVFVLSETSMTPEEYIRTHDSKNVADKVGKRTEYDYRTFDDRVEVWTVK